MPTPPCREHRCGCDSALELQEWLFQNTLRLLVRAGHWGCVCCEMRLFKHCLLLKSSMLWELEQNMARAQPVPAEGSWAHPRESRTHSPGGGRSRCLCAPAHPSCKHRVLGQSRGTASLRAPLEHNLEQNKSPKTLEVVCFCSKFCKQQTRCLYRGSSQQLPLTFTNLPFRGSLQQSVFLS